jgi:hypothetical protein
MHWIETIFHVDPDGGNGVLESVYVAAVLSALGVPLVRRILKRRAR